MRRKLSLACLLAAWLCANGVVWNVVQVVGWAKMFHDYAKVMPVSQALRVTFDGSASCHFCSIAEKGSDTTREQTPQSAPLGSGLDKLLLAADFAGDFEFTPATTTWPDALPADARSRRERVPVPPPRV